MIDFNEIRVVDVIFLSEIVYFIQYGEREGEKTRKRKRRKDARMEGGRCGDFKAEMEFCRDGATSSKNVCTNTKVSVVGQF